MTRTVEQHLHAALALARPTAAITVPLGKALGLVAAEPLRGRVDLPGFDNSAMDGYAVRSADVVGASPDTPVVLEVVADVSAGDPVPASLARGHAIRIMTGAPMPPAADAVVRVEDTDGYGQGTGGGALVEIRAEVPAGASVRRRGEDLGAGAAVLLPGQLVDARRIAVLAATGHAEAPVHRRPRVAIISTGAELVDPGKPLQDGQIHDSNSHMLAAAVRGAGGDVVHRGSVGDDPEQVRELIDRLAQDADVILSSGGVSMGVHDVVKAVLRERAEVEFVQVAMQPGKPQGLGVVGEALFFGLPGNPVSSFVSFELFVRPVLRRMLARVPELRPLVRATLVAPLRSHAGRRQIARATLTRDGDGWRADPVHGQGSHFVADLAASNAFVIIPEDVTEVHAGDSVEAMLLDEEGIG